MCHFRTAPSGGYFLTTEEGGVQRTYCHMDSIAGCGEGPWTLVMKISGYQVRRSGKKRQQSQQT